MKKRMPCVILVLALSVSPLVLAEEIKKGDTQTVPDREWVDVVNPKPVEQKYRGSTKDLKRGDTCSIQKGGKVTVIGIDGDRVLVRYTSPAPSIGTPCPSGVLFFVSKDKFQDMTPRYSEITAQEKREINTVKELLNQK